MLVDTKLIAVCGPDGASTATLVAELERRQDLPDCAYLARPDSAGSNAALLRRYAWPDGQRNSGAAEFKEALGVALAYDFLEFYDQAVQPLLGVKRFIVCDGHITCFIDYLKSIHSSFPIEASCAQVKPPDFVIHVNTPASPETAA